MPNGGHEESVTPVPGVPDDGQTLADGKQTLADADQTGSDRDQTAADSDQAASDQDQAASDRDLAEGGDRGEHEATRDIREQGTEQRRQTDEERIGTAAARDEAAHERDQTASTRDQAAAARDAELAARDAAWENNGRTVAVAGIALRTAENRKRAAADRAAAAEGRARAAADREEAARDREQAARDREQARSDREALVHQLTIAETDALTGARTRGAGLADLDQEIERARRTTGLLVAAYVDVVGLKAVNDAHGHAAGDALLRRAVLALRKHLRPYDLIVRLGGDEFLCVLSGATVQEGRERFKALSAGLRDDPDGCEVTVGLAALQSEDSAADLMARADAELPTRARRAASANGRS